jgi:hypothetical protein
MRCSTTVEPTDLFGHAIDQLLKQAIAQLKVTG